MLGTLICTVSTCIAVTPDTLTCLLELLLWVVSDEAGDQPSVDKCWGLEHA